MQSTAKTVDAFLAAQPEPLGADLQALREMVRSAAPEATEEMKYGMPVYSMGGVMVCGFNAQKNYLAFYVGRVPNEFRREMAVGFDVGKGCVRFKNLDPQKTEVLGRLLREVVAQRVTC